MKKALALLVLLTLFTSNGYAEVEKKYISQSKAWLYLSSHLEKINDGEVIQFVLKKVYISDDNNSAGMDVGVFGYAPVKCKLNDSMKISINGGSFFSVIFKTQGNPKSAYHSHMGESFQSLTHWLPFDEILKKQFEEAEAVSLNILLSCPIQRTTQVTIPVKILHEWKDVLMLGKSTATE